MAEIHEILTESIARKIKRAYKKPIFIKEEEMIFPKEIIKEFNKDGKYCLQCTSCHGCR